jgi:Protein of unknown function (DUF2946)
MRRRLWKFLPIVLMALAVQIFAPIGACWAASIAASDPLYGAPICSGDVSGSGHTDQTGGQHAHDGACSQCCVAQAAASLDAPQNAVATPWRQSVAVIWFDGAPYLFSSRTGAHAQARAPPAFS